MVKKVMVLGLLGIVLATFGFHVEDSNIIFNQAYAFPHAYEPEAVGGKEYNLVMKKIQGDWYNVNGYCLSFKGNYLNGCLVEYAETIAGGGMTFSAKLGLSEKKHLRFVLITLENGVLTYDGVKYHK